MERISPQPARWRRRWISRPCPSSRSGSCRRMRMNGVLASPFTDRLDRALFGDARIADPALATGLPGPPSLSLLETVPEPMIVPAPRRAGSRCVRDERAGSRTSCRRPHSAGRRGLPLRVESSGRCSLPASHASPSSSGVTATGESVEEGFDWKKPKPFPSSVGMRLRSDTSLTRTTRLDRRARLFSAGPHRHVAGDDGDLGLEIDAVQPRPQPARDRADRGRRRSRPDR